MVDGQLNTQQQRSFLLFEAGAMPCALSVEDVVEILPMTGLSCETGCGGILAGFLNFGGTAVAVLHLWRLLDTAEIPVDLRAAVIIVKHNGDRYGLIVSGIQQIISVAEADAVSLPPRSVTRMAVRSAQNLVPVICIGDMVMEQERLRIAQLQESQQKRVDELAGVSA